MTSWPTTNRRLVIDSNVWISALVFGGQPRAVIDRVVQAGYTIVLSEYITAEVRRSLQRKFPDFLEDFEALLVALEQRIEVTPLGSITINASRDPDDNRILETAVLGAADTIISGDNDLLALRSYEGIVIMDPSSFAKPV